jgi:hypothetical protein
MISVAINRFRMRAPSALRTAYRIVRSCVHQPRLSQDIPPHLVRDCRVFASRNELLLAVPGDARGLEVGTYRGDLARFILSRMNPRELHVLDIDYTHFDKDLLKDQRLHSHQGWSIDLIPRFDDSSFDWIYIDADHSYNATLRDARLASSKVKPGGLLIFNDFAHIDPFMGRYGVHRAVVDFMCETEWPMHSFAFQPAGLYDVALRRPAQ